jgi:hypothetical protein
MHWLCLVIVLGCAAKNPGPPGTGSGSATVPITIEGRYELRSELDLSTRLPGEPGDIARLVVDATDDPDDPARFIVDTLIARVSDPQIVAALHAVEPIVIGFVAERLQSIAPQLVARLRALGAAVDRASRHFGTVEDLDIAATARASHDLRSVRVDGVEVALRDHGIADAIAVNVPVSIDPTFGVTIRSHELALPYGRLLHVVLDAAIVPSVDPAAHGVYDFLRDAIDCAALGSAVSDALGLDVPAVFESACTSGLVEMSSVVYAHLDAIADAPLVLSLSGTARPIERGDHLDVLDAGTWAGTVGYAGADVALGFATFTGVRR